MVLSLSRILWLLPRRRAIANLDLAGLPDHDLADLNLPAELRRRAGLQRSREHGMGRW